MNTCHQGEIFMHFALQSAIFEIQGCGKSEKHRMTSDWLWTLNCQKYTVFTECLPQRHKFLSVFFYDLLFSRSKPVKIQKSTERPWIVLEHLTVKSTLILNTYCFSIRFALWTALFDIQGCRKNQKCTKWPQTDLKQLLPKVSCIHLCTLNTWPMRPNIGPFHSTSRRFRDTSLSKIKWTQTDLEHLTVKSTLYTLKAWPKFSSISFYY